MIYTSSYSKLAPVPKDINLYQHLFGPSHKSRPDDSIALADDSEKITYKQLHDLTTRIGAGFIKNAGLKVGDVVLMNAPTCPQFFVLFLSLQAAGILVALANPAYGPEEFSHAVKLVQAKMVVTADSSVVQVIKVGLKRSQIILFGPKSKENESLPEFRELALQSFSESQKVLESSGAFALRSDSLAAICYSSGTTSLPKSVALSHKNLIAESESLRLTPGFSAEKPEPVLNSLPAFHIAGLETILYALRERDNIHFAMKAPFDIVFVAKKMQEHKIGRIMFVPPILLGLIRHPSTKDMKFPHLRNIVVGAAPLGPDLHKEAQEKLGIPILQVWGLSETTGAVTMASPKNKIPVGSAGMLCSGAELRLVDPETGKDVEEGKPGECWVRSPIVFSGYYNNEKATKETFDGEWFKTGDIGVMTKTGDLFIVDRLKELLKYKGMQVAPAELEDVLLSHDKVADAAVVGIRDADGNDLPRAYIVPYPNVKVAEEELKKEVSDYIASKLAPFKRLRGGVVVVKEIPKNPSGKILRRILRDQANKEVKSKL